MARAEQLWLAWEEDADPWAADATPAEVARWRLEVLDTGAWARRTRREETIRSPLLS